MSSYPAPVTPPLHADPVSVQFPGLSPAPDTRPDVATAADPAPAPHAVYNYKTGKIILENLHVDPSCHLEDTAIGIFCNSIKGLFKEKDGSVLASWSSHPLHPDIPGRLRACICYTFRRSENTVAISIEISHTKEFPPVIIFDYTESELFGNLERSQINAALKSLTRALSGIVTIKRLSGHGVRNYRIERLLTANDIQSVINAFASRCIRLLNAHFESVKQQLANGEAADYLSI